MVFYTIQVLLIEYRLHHFDAMLCYMPLFFNNNYIPIDP
jgi:hypothetical protein